jgi:hypothetical protein
MKKLVIVIALLALLALAGWYVIRLSQMSLVPKDNNNNPTNVAAIKTYFVAVEGSNVSGPVIGCNDTLVNTGGEYEVKKGQEVEVAMNLLLGNKNKDIYNGSEKYYNTLYKSNLEFDRIEEMENSLNVYLTGDLFMSGVCDQPRITEQLEKTAGQFDETQDVQIYINGQRLEDVMLLR